VGVVDSIDAAKDELEAGRRTWLAFIVDTEGDGRAIHRLLKQMRRAEPGAPGLLMAEGPPRSPETLEEVGFRFLPRSASPAEVRYFLGHAIALAVTQDADVAAVVEDVGRERSLTIKQMELTALATTPLDRDKLIEGLGVSQNTVKTRIRQLLRIHQEDSMDTLGKTVLRAALARARGSKGAQGAAKSSALPAERKAVPRPKPRKKHQATT
jgi:hypothetical protein